MRSGKTKMETQVLLFSDFKMIYLYKVERLKGLSKTFVTPLRTIILILNIVINIRIISRL